MKLKTKVIQLRVEPELKAAASQAAKDNRRSLTSLIENLLEEYLRAHGYLKRKPR